MKDLLRIADLTAEIPVGLVEITRLPSVGPRTVGRLWKELDVTNVEELAAVDPERISSLKGFGKKSAEKMVDAARTYNATERRMLLDEATSLGEQILSFVRSHPATERAAAERDAHPSLALRDEWRDDRGHPARDERASAAARGTA